MIYPTRALVLLAAAAAPAALVVALAAPVLRHRVILSPAAEIEGRPVEGVIARLIEQVEAPR